MRLQAKENVITQVSQLKEKITNYVENTEFELTQRVALLDQNLKLHSELIE